MLCCRSGDLSNSGGGRSGVGICSMGVMRPDLIMRSIIPVVMAGVLGIYGLITAVRSSPLGAGVAGRGATHFASPRKLHRW